MMSRLWLLPLIITSQVLPLLHATTTEEDSSDEARCTDLNFRAAYLQGGDACRVLAATILNADFLAATAFDVARACHPANGNCIANALVVADEIESMPNCEISSGTNVAAFLSEVREEQIGFTRLMQLACHQFGECYQSILDGVDYCTAHPDMDWAGNCLLNNVTCDDNNNGGCLLDYLLPVLDSLPEHAPKGDSSTNFTYIVRDAEARCNCEALSTRATMLEKNDTPCAIAVAIVKEEDILIGNMNITLVVEKIDDTCDIPTEYTCVENALDIARGIDEYVCEDIGDTTFINMLRNSSTDFDDITNFACSSRDCYINLMACADTLGSSVYSATTIVDASGTTETVSTSPSESPSSSHQPSSLPSYTPSEQNTNFTCIEPLSCNCLTEFSSVTSNLSPTMKESLLKFNTTLLEQMRATTCCKDFNVEAANLIKMDYCYLHRAIVLEGSIFAGNDDETNSTCSEQFKCTDNISELLSKMKRDSCRVKQESDDIAESLYYVNITNDFEAITKFVCGNRECYNAVKVVVESCAQNSNTTSDCTQSATLDCLRSFVTVVNGISDEGIEAYLGISEYEMERVIPNWYLAITDRIANMATTQTTTSVITTCISILFVSLVVS